MLKFANIKKLSFVYLELSTILLISNSAFAQDAFEKRMWNLLAEQEVGILNSSTNAGENSSNGSGGGGASVLFSSSSSSSVGGGASALFSSSSSSSIGGGGGSVLFNSSSSSSVGGGGSVLFSSSSSSSVGGGGSALFSSSSSSSVGGGGSALFSSSSSSSVGGGGSNLSSSSSSSSVGSGGSNLSSSSSSSSVGSGGSNLSSSHSEEPTVVITNTNTYTNTNTVTYTKTPTITSTITSTVTSTRTPTMTSTETPVCPLHTPERVTWCPSHVFSFYELSIGSAISAKYSDGLWVTWGNDVHAGSTNNTSIRNDWIDVEGGLSDYYHVISRYDKTCYFGNMCRDNYNSVTCVDSSSTNSVYVGVSGFSIKQLAVGPNHNCAVGLQGTLNENQEFIATGSKLYCWGDNTYGQLGLGDTLDRSEPTLVTLPINPSTSREFEAIYVSVGEKSSCAILAEDGVNDESGYLYCWGDNNEGQLGIGSNTSYLTPQLVSSSIIFERVEQGLNHVCAVATSANFYCWGDNSRGQVGVGDSQTIYTTPQLVNEDYYGNSVSMGPYSLTYDFSLGNNHTCMIGYIGTPGEPNQLTPICWGDNSDHQIGVDIPALGHFSKPIKVDSNASLYMDDIISAGPDWTCMVDSSVNNESGGPRSNLWCWGKNIVNGYKRITSTDSTHETTPVNLFDCSEATPTKTATNTPPADATATFTKTITNTPLPPTFTRTFTATPTITDTPLPEATQTFTKTITSTTTFTPTITPTPINQVLNSAKYAALGDRHTCVLAIDNNLYCYGSNGSGQVGDTTTANRNIPLDVLSGVREASLGASHSCVVSSSNELYCWGSNAFGQAGETFDLQSPQKVTSLSNTVSRVYTGQRGTCTVTTNGDLYCFGENQYGQLGNGTTSSEKTPTPQQVKLTSSSYLTDVSQVSVGDYHVCAVKSTGALYCWGKNNSGQLGLNNTTNSSYAKEVMQGIKEVSCGNEVTCAVKISGELFCFGKNDHGQVGAGLESATIKVPTKVMMNVNHVIVGSTHVCATTNSGVYCFGNNDKNQVGNGSDADTITPQKILDGNFSYISGYNHTCAIRQDGALFCWGYNSEGQIGNGISGTNPSSPAHVLSNIIHVNVGGDHTCATDSNNKLYCFGRNDEGQIGDRTNTDKPSPTVIFDGSGGHGSLCSNCCEHWNYSNINSSCTNELSNACLTNGVYNCYGQIDNPSIVCNVPAPNCCDDAGYATITTECHVGVGYCADTGIYYCSGDFVDSVVDCSAVEGGPREERCNGIDDNCNNQTDEDFKFNGISVGDECTVLNKQFEYQGQMITINKRGYVRCINEGASDCIDIFDEDNDGVSDGEDRCLTLIDGRDNAFYNDNGSFLYNETTCPQATPGCHPLYYSATPYAFTDDTDNDGFINCMDSCPFDDAQEDDPFAGLGEKDNGGKKKFGNNKEVGILGDGCGQIPIGGIITNTPTPTYTQEQEVVTNTPTDTFTLTNTFTYTLTDIPTETPTDIPTNTPSETPSFTFTNTSTDTPTNTFTDTVTNTFTHTITDTPDLGDADTNTFTNTPTNTSTFTDTDTFTSIFTSTFTNTFTPTDTQGGILPTVATLTPLVPPSNDDADLEVVTPETELPSTSINAKEDNDILTIQLPKFKKASINGHTDIANAKYKYVIHVRKLKRLGVKDNFYKLGKRFLTYNRKNKIKFKNMDKGIYSVRYQVIILKGDKERKTKWSKRTLVVMS